VPILAHGVGDAELWEILRRGLAKSPADRWPSMRALGQALARWLRHQGVRDDVSGVLIGSKWLGRNRTEPVLVPLKSGRTEAVLAAVEPKTRRSRARYFVLSAAIVAVAVGLVHSTRASDGALKPPVGDAVAVPSPLQTPATVWHAATAPSTSAAISVSGQADAGIPNAEPNSHKRRATHPDLMNPYE
jgi:hypothetical protein